MKAVIVDIQGGSAAALKENGDIVLIKNDHYEIGQSIEISECRTKERKSSVSGRIKKLSSIAAAVAVLTAAGSVTAYALPYGTVSLDTEPAVEYTINCFDYVLDVNIDGDDTVLSQNELDEMKNRKVDDAIKTTVEKIDVSCGSDCDVSVNIEAETKNDTHTEKLKRDIDNTLRSESMNRQQTVLTENTEDPGYPASSGVEFPEKGQKEQGTEDPSYSGNMEENAFHENGGPAGDDLNNAPGEPVQNRDEGGGVPFLIHE